MEQLGRLTLPTDADVVEETLRLKNLLGADALRDCDGTEMLMLGVLICTLPTAIIFLCLQKSFANGITGAVK